MPLDLKNKYSISVDTTEITVSDDTGMYNASTKPGGWGAPNELLSQVALVAMVRRIASTGTEYFEPLSAQVVYDPGAANDKVTTFTFTYLNDGVIDVILVALDVSLNGTTLVKNGAAIPADSFYYYGGQVRKEGYGTPITDYTYLLGPTSVNPPEPYVSPVIETTQDIPVARLAVVLQKLYKQWTLLDKCNTEDTLFQEHLRLRSDMEGATSAFRGGLTVQAQDMVETLLAKYSILNRE